MSENATTTAMATALFMILPVSMRVDSMRTTIFCIASPETAIKATRIHIRLCFFVSILLCGSLICSSSLVPRKTIFAATKSVDHDDDDNNQWQIFIYFFVRFNSLKIVISSRVCSLRLSDGADMARIQLFYGILFLEKIKSKHKPQN